MLDELVLSFLAPIPRLLADIAFECTVALEYTLLRQTELTK